MHARILPHGCRLLVRGARQQQFAADRLQHRSHLTMTASSDGQIAFSMPRQQTRVRPRTALMNRYRANDANLGRLTPAGLTWATLLVPLMQVFGHQQCFQLVRGRMRTASWIVMTKRCQFASFGPSCFSRQAMALGNHSVSNCVRTWSLNAHVPASAAKSSLRLRPPRCWAMTACCGAQYPRRSSSKPALSAGI